MSANIRGSAARSSSATDAFSDTSDLGTLARSGISSVIIASEWHFKPAGVMEVEKRFAEKRDRMRAVSSDFLLHMDKYLTALSMLPCAQ